MKIVREQSLRDFPFWGGAEKNRIYLTLNELDVIEQELSESWGDEPATAVEINDLFWFETDVIAGYLGFADWEDLMQHRDWREGD